MRVWDTIFNFFAILILAFIVVSVHRDIRVNEEQLAKIKLDYAIDYATEGAFITSLEGGNLGISYQDLQNVRINPENTLEVFKTILALNYNMSLSTANLNSLDAYISSAVLAVDDGYYIATLQQTDTEEDNMSGGSYKLKWGLKKPYKMAYSGNRYVGYNISSEEWVLVKPSGSSVSITSGETWSKLATQESIAPTRDLITKEINKLISDDINYNIKKMNEINRDYHKRQFIYLPSATTTSGVNNISKPSLFITLSNVDFGGTQRIEAQSVGGFTIAKKVRVLGFTEGGVRYYCYEGQLPNLNLVEKFFNTVDDAAMEGYRPHVDYLRNDFRD